MRTRIIFLLFFLLSGRLCANVSPYKSYSVIDGMPNSTVKAVCQDTLGYIWMGTRNGLVRFDGYEFRTYNYDIEQINSVSCNDITCLTQDKAGRIWIGTFNWITLFNPFTEQFVELELDYPENTIPQGVVTNIWFDDRDRIWVSAKNGLYVIGNKEVSTIDALSGAYINSMGAIDQKTLLLEVMGKGTALFDTDSGHLTWIDESLSFQKRPMIYKIYRDRSGRVWAGADSNHIYEYDSNAVGLRQVNIDLPKTLNFDKEQIHDIIEYNDSTLIFATDNGLLAINTHTLQYLPDIVDGLHTDLLQGYRVMCLYQDRQQAIWAGTFGKGVKYTNPNRYRFNLHQLPAGNGVVGELVEKDGKLWVGHEFGLSCIDLTDHHMEHIDLESQLQIKGKKTEVFSLYHNKKENLLYLYLLNRGLYAFDTRNRSIVKQVGLPVASQVRSMAEDRLGNMWIAEEELSVYQPQSGELNSFLSTNINNTTSFMLTQDLLLRNNGNMLVGTRTSGVWEYPYDEQNRKHYNAAHQMNYEELKNKNVNILFEDSHYNLWIGTYGSGLFLCNKEERQCLHYTTENGLANNSICGITEDENTGHVWVTTLNGISKINPADGNIINYTNQTGFPLEEVSRKAFLKASNGLYYVGGSNGLTSFNPELFTQNTEAPHVTVSLVSSLNEKGRADYRFDNFESLKRIKIPFKYSSLRIRFSALNYFFPEGNRYCYKLEGVDDEWTVTERNEVVYTTLHEGKYVFKIKASNNEGHWSEHISEVSITILPPLWRTGWAKAFYFLLASGIIYFMFQIYSDKKTAKYKQQINQIEKDNIKRYYQMKLELFTKFSHELRTPLTLITGPAEDMAKDGSLPQKFRYPINLIHKNANRLLLLVNQLMDVRKMEHGAMKLRISQVDVNDFLSEQIENFNELARKKHIKLTYQNRYWGKNVWFDKELMEKVIFNLLSNAIKYTSPEGEITLSAWEQNAHLLISVKDNGDGIPAEHLEDIFNPFYQVSQGQHAGMPGSGIGLNLAKYVVNLHQGTIRAESTQGQGSEFFIELPLGILHFDESHTEFVTPATKESEQEPSTLQPANETNTDKILSENKIWILVAEDDDELRAYIVSLLQAEYSVIEASDGKEALALTVERIPDLIISDIMMPCMDGIELCHHIKENISTAHIPVILLTAKVMNENIQEGYEALADDYIVKPFDSGLLKARIRNLIENRNHLRQLFSNQMTALDVPVAEVSSTDPFMEKLFRIVEARIDDPELSINDIAAEIGVSRAQFFRKVKALSDVSPNRLIINIRMKMAVDMLKSDSYSISEVAYKVGFNDPAYFSKSFKSTFGLSPSEFCKRK